MNIFKANSRDDLSAQFTDNLRLALAEWQMKHGNSSISISSLVDGDNLIEENMDVENDQDDKHKKQITTNSNYSDLSSEFYYKDC